MSDERLRVEERQPALIVRSRDEDYQMPKSHGGPAKVFDNIDETRQRLLRQFDNIKDRLYSAGTVGAGQVALARLKYRTKAIAKSHRATAVFTPETCPVIGDQGAPGELLVLVSPPRLESLSKTVRGLGEQDVRHLTAIESIELLSSERRFPRRMRTSVVNTLQRDGEVILNIRMANFGLFSMLDQRELEAWLADSLGSTTAPYVNFGNFSLYAVSVRSIEQVMSIARLQIVDRVEPMPVFIPFGTEVIDIAGIRVAPDAPMNELPIVAIVDTGIERNCPLEELVLHHDDRVPDSFRDTTHGTGVAALVASGGLLEDSTFVPRARLLDLGVIPGKGKRGIDQRNLVEVLEEALELYSDDVKHWNLSLGRTPGTRPSEFSDLGQILDNFHKRYGVQFYCAAGNCTEENLRTMWPPVGPEKEEFISSPGDSICAITVGSCTPSNPPFGSSMPAEAPAPYSARGPITYSVTKPDLCVPEGNLLTDGTGIGLRTLKPNGDISTDQVGTSFAVPTVSGTVAELTSCLALGGLAPIYQQLVAKTMMVHHATIPAVFGASGSFRFSDYYGYGRPASVQDMMEDPFWRSTSLILAELLPGGGDFVIDDLPYPDGLFSGSRYRGKILLTAVTEPLLDPNFKVEYARSNVDVHLNVLQRKEDGRLQPIAPAKALRMPGGYETTLIREQQKWSAIKQYRTDREISCTGERWRLWARLTMRDLESEAVKANPETAAQYRVPLVIAITIEDPTRTVNVNNEMVLKWRSRGYVTESVQVAARVRSRFASSGN